MIYTNTNWAKIHECETVDKLFLISGQSKTESKSGLYFRLCSTFVVMFCPGKDFTITVFTGLFL